MSAVVLCETPTDAAGARSWLLARIALMTMTGDAVLLFAGAEQEGTGVTAVDVVAARFSSLERAAVVVDSWRRERDFPRAALLRLIRIDSVQGADLLIPMFP